MKKYIVKTDIGTFKNIKAESAEKAKLTLMQNYICKVTGVTEQTKDPEGQYGNVIKQLFEYVKLNEPCSYTDMNKFYQMKIKGKTSYDPVKDRGGSFSHHLISMRNKSKRNYSGKVEYLIKATGHKGKYYAYTLNSKTNES